MSSALLDSALCCQKAVHGQPFRISATFARARSEDIGAFLPTQHLCFSSGIARPEKREISSLSCESQSGEEIVVSVFDVLGHPAAIQVE